MADHSLPSKNLNFYVSSSTIMKRQHLPMLCFLFTLTAAAAADDPNRISINCGGAAAVTGREWRRDTAPQGSSTAATVKGELIAAVDPVPYKTARISRSKFSYSFPMSPGQKIIRLHFNPASYHGFQSFNDLFTVEAGPFTLLANFSASITARALSVNTLLKEFCVIIQENQPLDIVFSPESKTNYAFINGIEIISLPSTVFFCHGGDSAIHVLGQKHEGYVDNTTALEIVHRQNIKWASSASSEDEIGSLFGMLASTLKENADEAYNKSWGVSVDVGFRYLVRLHWCELGLKLHSDFMLLINNMTVLTSADHHHHMLQQRGDQSIHWYNCMVMVEGKKREGKRRITISLQSQHQFLDRHGPLEGFEVFKLSNHDRSLASPNPLLPSGDPPSHTIHTRLCSLVGCRNATATYFITFFCLLCIIVHLVSKIWGPHLTGEDNKPSTRAKRLIPCISLAKIIAATENFHEGFVIGKGGFGKVYKAVMFMDDDESKNVAIKRLKPDSKQGGDQFWTEVETLSGLKHANIITLIGYCKEQQEMILVYELMPRGTLADHLYKLAKKINDFNPLSWKQRLTICIGAARALDYLHTGCGIIHRDVKSSNILLDEEFVAILSDFGLAKAGSGSDSQSEDSTTRVRGTVGYMDPSYCRNRKVTKKSDTYSLAVVLLEVLCGRPALERWNDEDKRSLSTWAIDNISKGQVDDIVAPSLRGRISPDSLKTFVEIAERCLHDEPEQRPAMTYVVIKLQLALQQQEKAESLARNKGTVAGDVSSSTQKSRDNICVADALPQKENARPSAQNGITNVTPDKPQQEIAKAMSSDEKARVGSELPVNVLTDTSYLTVIKDGRSSMMRRISQRLWSWKASSRKDFVGISLSAPIPCGRSSNITLIGRGMI